MTNNLNIVNNINHIAPGWHIRSVCRMFDEFNDLVQSESHHSKSKEQIDGLVGRARITFDPTLVKKNNDSVLIFKYLLGLLEAKKEALIAQYGEDSVNNWSNEFNLAIRFFEAQRDYIVVSPFSDYVNQ